MTVTFNVAEAKAKLSELISRAEAGEEVVLARAGRPVATITRLDKKKTGKRRLGLWDHLGLKIPDDLFIGPDPDTAEAVDSPIFPPE